MSAGKRKSLLSLKQLESYLQDLDGFEDPKIELEQYATPPHIAALMLNTIDLTYNDLEDKFVADLGCGTGRLTAGSLLCGAAMVFGFDMDQAALDCGLHNMQGLFSETDADMDNESTSITAYRDCSRFNFVRANLATMDCDNTWTSLYKKFDTVIMNPPFGTKQNEGLDMIFLERAISLAHDVVYSLHKTSTRNFIMNKCHQRGVRAKPIAQIRYNLDNTYRFHRKKSVDIDVDLWQIKCLKRPSK